MPELAAGVQPGVHDVEGVLPPAAQAHQLGGVGVHSDPGHLGSMGQYVIRWSAGSHLKLPDVATGGPGVKSVELPAIFVPLYAVNLENTVRKSGMIMND